ncbi:proteasome-type protease [Stieleria sp. TO1_6]|uniref:proteasome-type protease n=1 Tax=Stieleria tagensis TaxID=2956795 RepID=UPI00209B1CA8|nr:proteasome-type protease [Stieleria tagensis]MCO8125258.1 proteasome-type protease [Stieleria tagensis]
MTFCIGIQVREGIVALADTRIVRGSEQVNKQKLAAFQHSGGSLFTMTSGLRSVRDKTLVYVEEVLRETQPVQDRLYQFANLFGQQLRRVKQEDGPSLSSTGHSFNLHAIIGGCLVGDQKPQLFYIYPEGNWVEAAVDSPYFMIGRTYYGKPILDRLLTYETPLQSAISLALLAFDATHASVTDVDFPIDLMVIPAGTRQPISRRYSESDLKPATQWWSNVLSESLASMPMQWAQELLPNGSFPSNNASQPNDTNSNW